MFKKKPADPLTSLAHYFLQVIPLLNTQSSENIPVIDHVSAREIYLNEYVVSLEVTVFCQFSGKVQPLSVHRLAFSSTAGFTL